ncbi:GNAT family N-acetyltransferase [Mucilaginibacter sp. OK283]|uniref:GNAT family N-acetyltransferase n=1 Tax=Mucilaginibacter sp. OK283 TaxID=1881049 RepID=UPI0008C6205B|nr:GNAT family N-acetyltransferase [Mucilaginibacter sp. OK283]SEO94326.1 Acetyltransferase (GNAT) family protein [Mucilaginibacter sp. OK283]
METSIFTQPDIGLLNQLQPADWPDIVPNFYFYVDSPFCFPIKVVINDAIAGIGAAIIHADVAWLGHIIVHPEHRSKGIGFYITQNLVDIAHQHRCQTINLIATAMGAPVYEKAGFITETEYLFFKDIQIQLPGLPTLNIKPYQEKFLQQILAIDQTNSQENREPLLREHVKTGLIYCNDDTVEGYYLPGLGEGLIIANTACAGIELMKLHLRTNDKIAFPKNNSNAVNFLYEKGYKEIRTAKRMRLGKARNVIFSSIYNRIAGNIG